MMDRSLKERIIGAVVLVAVVVLVVPVFLDGRPGSDEIVSERVPLPGQSDQKSQTVVLDLDRNEPVPASSKEPAEASPAPDQKAKPEENAPATAEATPSPAAETKTPAAATKKPVATTKMPAAEQPTRSVAPPVGSTTGMWAVQLGSFSSHDNAERLAADLRKQGFAAFLSQLTTDSGQLHRVRVGPQKDRESAEAMASRLLKVGHKGQVVPHP